MIAPLVVLALSWPMRAQQSGYEEAITACERALARDPLANTYRENTEPYAERLSIRDDLEVIYAKYGRRARTLRDLGRCARMVCQFGDALTFLSSAVSLDLKDEKASVWLAEAKAARLAGEFAANSIGKGRQPTSVEKGPDGRWYVLTATARNDPFRPIGDNTELHKYDLWERQWQRVRLSVVSGGKEPKLVWSEPPPRGSEDTRDYENECTLVFKDLDGDSKPECLIWSVYYGADILPQSITVYRVRATPAFVGSVGATEGLRLKDIDRDGTIEVMTTDALHPPDGDLGHWCWPRWTDVQQLGPKGFRIVNKRFPMEFGAVRASVDQALKMLAGKPEPMVRILEARVLDIQGNAKAAKQALSRAEEENRALQDEFSPPNEGRKKSAEDADRRKRYREYRQTIRKLRTQIGPERPTH